MSIRLIKCHNKLFDIDRYLFCIKNSYRLMLLRIVIFGLVHGTIQQKNPKYFLLILWVMNMNHKQLKKNYYECIFHKFTRVHGFSS